MVRGSGKTRLRAGIRGTIDIPVKLANDLRQVQDKRCLAARISRHLAACHFTLACLSYISAVYVSRKLLD